MPELIHSHTFNDPIPLDLSSVQGWKEVEIRESGEPLVALGPNSKYLDIFTNSIYFGELPDSPYFQERFDGSLITIYVRESVAEQLRKAQSLLPQGTYLIAYDGFRTLEVQKALFDRYYQALQNLHDDWGETELTTETQKYVSLPSFDETRPSPHNTGGAIDVALFQLPLDIDLEVQKIANAIEIAQPDQKVQLQMLKASLIRQHAQILDFGTPFDWGGIEASLCYFEQLQTERDLTNNEVQARDNRRLLYNVMKSVGFEQYLDEWWHFNSKKSQMGAKTAELPYAEYGPISLTTQQLFHEQERVTWYQDTLEDSAMCNFTPSSAIAPSS
jgi:zinc D-Ala-D-Ala dipeptidase